MNKMWARSGVLATVAIAVAALAAVPAQAAQLSWQPAVLPLPAGADPAGHGFLKASNGRGEYTGSFIVDGKLQVVSWRGGKPVLRGVPDGFEWAMAEDENGAGTVVGTAIDYDTGAFRSFVLDATGFHLRETPAGYREAQTTAVNARGDVLGQVFGEDPARNGAIVWPADGGAPVIIPATHQYEIPLNIDDDGTVLFSSYESGLLWKDGSYRELTAPGFRYTSGSAIRNGVVVGSASDGTVAGSRAMRWNSAGVATVLPGGDAAYALNRAGLTYGTAPVPGSFRGTPTTWFGTTPSGDLRQPGSYPSYQASQVTDNGTFAGIASNGPLDEGGVPVVWRLAG
ncbi:hypothetical protein SAMN04489727_0831 [Amycolatopsis tolypomycina]|uniref:Extracellular repeat, HAF family n=1 Tax=Amycolatopsis tolypomycina TaxID=208445 RepID=A0A1H4IID4_9PSEU|nr:hypothetical protein [Amycolatopsis tolypomycina]SEB33750.1 hypothetical protein SAMN04489727_0831 [Amycolatopsis tolypomycina]